MTKKRALVVGVANRRSIAAYIADSLHNDGFELAFTYQNDRLKGKVSDLLPNWDSSILIECDASSEESIDNMYNELNSHWPEGFDVLIHAVAFAPKEELEGCYLEKTTKNGFMIAHEVSSYSLLALVQKAGFKLRDGASVISLSYLGAQRFVPNYNVMGLAKASLEANVRYLAAALGQRKIRVNAISAGAIKTLASAGISGFKNMLDEYATKTPLKANVDPAHVGETAAFLASDKSGAITGQIIYADNGYNISSI